MPHLVRYTNVAHHGDICRRDDQSTSGHACPNGCTVAPHRKPWCYYKTSTNPCRVPPDGNHGCFCHLTHKYMHGPYQCCNSQNHYRCMYVHPQTSAVRKMCLIWCGIQISPTMVTYVDSMTRTYRRTHVLMGVRLRVQRLGVITRLRPTRAEYRLMVIIIALTT